MDILFVMWLLCMFPLTIKWNGFFEDPLSRERTNVLKGISAIVIIFIHLANLTGSGKFFPIFPHIGYLFVGIFFFISGYGLMKNYVKKGNDYLSFFLSKRLATIIIPYALVNLIYLLYKFIDEGSLSMKAFLISFINGNPVVIFSWYVIAIVFFYILFYICFKFVKPIKLSFLLFFTITVVYIIGCRFLEYGIWWYNTCLALLLGLIWVYFEKEIILWYQRHYTLKVIAIFSIFLIAFLLSKGKIIKFKDYFVVGQMICTIVFTLFAIIIYSKIELKNKVWRYLGDISFELYMLHGLMLEIFRSRFIFLENNLMYSAAVLISAILLATLIHYVTSKIFIVLRNKEKIVATVH